MEVTRTVDRLTWPLKRRVLLMVGRAVLLLVDDARKLQSVQVQALQGETLDRVERMQQYGLTSHPHPGAEVLLLSVGGMRQHPVAAAIDDRRHRPTNLAAGETCLYTDEDGDDAPHRVWMKRGRVTAIEAAEIRLSAGGTTVTISSAGVDVDGPSLTHGEVNVGDDHTHGGVATGPGRTGGPG